MAANGPLCLKTKSAENRDEKPIYCIAGEFFVGQGSLLRRRKRFQPFGES
jgi:hypothetical protein